MKIEYQHFVLSKSEGIEKFCKLKKMMLSFIKEKEGPHARTHKTDDTFKIRIKPLGKTNLATICSSCLPRRRHKFPFRRVRSRKAKVPALELDTALESLLPPRKTLSWHLRAQTEGPALGGVRHSCV